MRIAFRVDSSTLIGTGHVMRCMNLAQVLQERGVAVLFICRNLPGNLTELIRRQEYAVIVLQAPDAADTPLAPLDDSVEADALQTILALKNASIDWLVVDHYHIDLEWERRVRPCVGKLMVIDDLANRPHDCDLLLDQNYSVETESRYDGLVPSTCRLLLGPRFALLRAEYAQGRGNTRFRDGRVQRVLVFFSGSDLSNMTGTALQVLSESQFVNLEVDIVLGANSPHRSSVLAQVAQRANTTTYEQQLHLADLMAQADLAMGAAGVTAWERLCLGLPAIVVDLAENQKPGSAALLKDGLIYHAGDAGCFPERGLRLALQIALGDEGQLRSISERGQLIVDGLGAKRCAEVLCPSGRESLCIREANIQDVGLYFNWANDPLTRQQALCSEPIPWDSHQKWFIARLDKPGSFLFVMETGGLPVGQIRFDRDGDSLLIDYSIDCLARLRGWSKEMIGMAVGMLPSGSHRLLAKVKKSNAASCAVFSRLGFEELLPIDGSSSIRFFRADSEWIVRASLARNE